MYLNIQDVYEKFLSSDVLELNLKIDLQWFAAEDEDRTEEPTEHQIKKAREQGRVAKSQDLNASVVVLVPSLVLIITAPYIFKSLMQIILFFFERCTTETVFSGAWFSVFIISFLKNVFPITIAALIAAVVSSLIQTKGFMFSTKPIQPDFSRIIPNFPRFFKRALFSAEGVVNLLKSIFKVAVIGIISYSVIKTNIPTLISLLQTNFADSIFFIAKTASKILTFSAIALFALSFPDYFYQKKQFKESLKLTKAELTREWKELEGDPDVKREINRRMYKILQKTGIKNVPEADVVITNPTHFAVALQFRRGEMPAPKVISKGTDSVAQNIKRIARENNIPLVENVPLARALYANVELGQVVPEEYYKSLSIVFMKVYKMKGKYMNGLHGR